MASWSKIHTGRKSRKSADHMHCDGILAMHEWVKWRENYVIFSSSIPLALWFFSRYNDIWMIFHVPNVINIQNVYKLFHNENCELDSIQSARLNRHQQHIQCNNEREEKRKISNTQHEPDELNTKIMQSHIKFCLLYRTNQWNWCRLYSHLVAKMA